MAASGAEFLIGELCCDLFHFGRCRSRCRKEPLESNESLLVPTLAEVPGRPEKVHLRKVERLADEVGFQIKD